MTLRTVKSPAGDRLRAGILPVSPDRQVIMISKGDVDGPWIFPRGGLDSILDNFDKNDQVPGFRRAAAREADEEAGCTFTWDPKEFHFLTRSNNAYEYWFLAPYSTLKENFVEKVNYPKMIVKLFTGEEALAALMRDSKKPHTLMIEALNVAVGKEYIVEKLPEVTASHLPPSASPTSSPHKR